MLIVIPYDQTFAFSAGKVGVWGGFASSVALGVVALMMLIESGERILHPHHIRLDEAIAVAGFGLAINLICALLLKGPRHHKQPHDHARHHHDHNLKAVYLHVLADVLASVLAIIALVLAKYYGWNWFDPVTGIVGGLVITRWSSSLMKETGPVLLDESIDLKY